MEPARKSPIPDVHVVQVSDLVDHLAGVEDELSARGLSVYRQDEEYRTPRVRRGTKVVVVTDLFDPRCVRALRMARRAGAKTVLMMDGLTDWRNIFVNPRVGDRFLRPAPVDLVCCSGMVDRRVLASFGNTAVATGLPRIDAAFGQTTPVHVPGPVLVATANNPAFNEDERARILVALRELKQASQWARTRLVWRLTDGLDEDLGVRNRQGPLARVLDDCGSVITTASTLQVEAMRAGKPTAILHPHNTPIWQPSAFVWQPIDSQSTPDPSGVEPLVHGLTRWVDSPERLLRQLSRPTQEQMRRQSECLNLIDASAGEASAAELVAEAIANVARSTEKPNISAPLRSIARLPSHKPKRAGRKRIVSVVPFEYSPIGGVTTWSQRLAEALERKPELGYDMHTVLVATRPGYAHRAESMLSDRTSLCVVDHTDDHFVTLANLRRAVELHEPDIVLPNYSDMAYAVATQLRYSGVPSVAISHTDHGYYNELVRKYPDWDGAVAVSGSIESWLKPLAGQRPTDTIVYGVPSSSAPRTPAQTGPIRLAYVGRVERIQKRIMDLVPMVHTLAAKGVEAELHIVGEGSSLDELRSKLVNTGSVKVVFHGAQSPAWVESFWQTVDIAVLVSEYEGTSITMLEAMGQGVVPAVTRVDSGVDEWVEEGVTGVTSPVGEPEQLAQKIAEISADRGKLCSIGQSAWTRVSFELGLDEMAAKYAALFDRVCARDVPTRPSLAGLTIGDWHVWAKPYTEDGEGEVSWLRARLKEAGYRSIAVHKPRADSDAVIVPAGYERLEEIDANAWQRGGIDVVWSSLVKDGGIFGKLNQELSKLLLRGYSRIAIYGLGRHTQKYAGLIESGYYPIVGFIDDNPPKSGAAFGMPAVAPEQAIDTLSPDCVLISSDAWEREMWLSTAEIREAGVPVHTIYGTYEEVVEPLPVSC